jgi:hypothetical protein
MTCVLQASSEVPREATKTTELLTSTYLVFYVHY